MDIYTILNTSINSIIWMTLIVVFIISFKKRLDAILAEIPPIIRKTKSITFPNGHKIVLGSNALSSQNPEYNRLKKAYQKVLVTNEKDIIKKQLDEARLTPEEKVEILIDHLANSHVDKHSLEIYACGELHQDHLKLLSYLNDSDYKSESELLTFFQNINVTADEIKCPLIEIIMTPII